MFNPGCSPLLLANAALAGIEDAEHGGFKVRGGDAVSPVVDEFTQMWCALPTPRGSVAACVHCGWEIACSVDTDRIWAWPRWTPNRGRARRAWTASTNAAVSGALPSLPFSTFR